MALTDTSIKAAVRSQMRRKIFDGGGLYLLVDPPRQPGWRLKYRVAGREKLLSLGVYPTVTLKRARERRDDARRQISDGIDPSAERQAARAAQADTFKAIAEEWLGTQKNLSAGTIQRDRDRLSKYIYPTLGNAPIKTITAPALLTPLKRIEARGTLDTGLRTRSICSRVFRYAIATGRAERDVAADLHGALATPVVKNFASIKDPAAIGQLLRDIDTYSGQPATEAALKLAAHVFVRPGELRQARWEELDLDAGEWRIPAERMKMGEMHLVPLSTQAVEILRDLYALTGPDGVVFASLRSASRPMSNNTINAALRRLGYSKDQMTGHGFRSIASTLLNEQGFHPDLIELQLAHAERNAVRAAYNKAQRLAERRKMMQAWSDYLDTLKAARPVNRVQNDGLDARI